MNPFTAFVEPLSAAIFALAQIYSGNLGAAIMTVTLFARALMLPLTLEMARRATAHRKALESLRPELEKLRRRFKNKPQRLAEESARLFEQRSVKPVDPGQWLGALLQAPIFVTLWAAARQVSQAGGRFLWIGDLARPDAFLTVLGALLTGAGALAAGVDAKESARALAFALPAVLTLVFLWKASAGVGLYWASSSAVGLAQGYWLRRRTDDSPTT